MAVTTINITGQVLPSTGDPEIRSRVIFTMTGYDTDSASDATIYPAPEYFPIAADGTIDVDLWPNQAGARNTKYKVEVEAFQINRPIVVPLGLISVPTTGTYDLNELLGIEPPADATVAEYIAELAAAVAASEAAAGIATAAAGTATSAAGAAAASAALIEDAIINEDKFVLSIGASAIAGKAGATGGSLDIFNGVNTWDSDSTGATYVAGSSFSQAVFGNAPLNWGGGLANSTPLQVMNAIRQARPGDVYGAFLAMGGQAPEALITDATLTANSWTRDPSDEDLTLYYANIQSAIDAMPGSKTVADYLVYYQHNNSGTGRDYYQPRVKAILDDLVTAGLIDDTTRIVMVEASPERTDDIIESVQTSLSDIASRDYPNAVTVGQGGIPTFDTVHPSGVGCVWLGQRIAQALLGGGISASQRMILLDRSNSDLDSFAEWNKWNGDNLRMRMTNDSGWIESNWNPQSQAFRITGTGDVHYMRVESTGIEDTAIGADTPSTGDFTALTASGNIIMGTTEAWTFAATWGGIKITDRHGLQATKNSNSVALSSNSAIGPSGWEYTVDADAGKYTIAGDVHIWEQAASGTDGDPVTWSEAMRLDGSGRLHIGHDGSTSTPGIGNATAGTTIQSGGRTIHSRDSGPAMDLARVGATPDGQLVRFYSGATGVERGSIDVDDSEIVFNFGGGVTIRAGTGSPEGVVTASPSSQYLNRSGGAGVSVYVKETGTGNTGWVAK